MTAFALVTIDLTDPDTFAAYRTKAGAFMAKHGAEPVAVSAETQVIEGTGPAPDVSVILSFPDRDHALAWINDPEAAAVHGMRRASGASRILLL